MALARAGKPSRVASRPEAEAACAEAAESVIGFLILRLFRSCSVRLFLRIRMVVSSRLREQVSLSIPFLYMLERLSATLALVEDMVFVKDFFCIVFILFSDLCGEKTVQKKQGKKRNILEQTVVFCLKFALVLKTNCIF